MCLDNWNKIVKISYDPSFIHSHNMLLDVNDINY
jgi:hypothetical protein